MALSLKESFYCQKLHGKPYPKYITSGISDDKHDNYFNTIRRPRTDSEMEETAKYAETLDSRTEKLKSDIIAPEVEQKNAKRAKISPKDIAEAAKGKEVATAEVSGIKKLIGKLKEKTQEKGEI